MRIKMPAMRIAQADAEVIQDILTCGACQKPFALADICKFIQHKNLSCNKENYSCGFTGAEQDVNEDSDDGAQPMSVNSRRPSISAPISGKKSGQMPQAAAPVPSSLLDAAARLEERLGVTAPPPSPQHPGASSSHDALLAASSPGSRPASRMLHSQGGDFKPRIKQESDVERARASRSPDVADAESNTVLSEPSNYACSTCKQRFQSAWTLMQHVQQGHGIKIYIDLASTPPPTSSSSSSHVPLAPPVVSRLHELPPRSSMPPLQAPLPSALDPHNPFNLLRMPLGGDRNAFSNSSLAAAAAALNPFARPPSSHDFRMEQLVSEQFRLNPHAGLGLAAALEQARPSQFATDPFERPPSTRSTASTGALCSTPVPPQPPISLASLNPESQLDFYSQRLRQLAGTTSPGGGSSPSARKQILTPPFTSPNNNSTVRSSQQETTPPAGASAAHHKANNAHPSTSGSSSSLLSQSLNNSSSLSGNGSVGRASLSPPQMRPPSQPLSSSLPTCGPHESDLTPLPSTPRAQSTPPDPSKAAGEAAAEAATNLASFHHHNHHHHHSKNKSCEFCGKRFKFISNLIVHRRSHTGEKPYRCPICNHTCSQASKLKRHMKIHRAARKNGAVMNGSTNSTPESGETDSLGGSIETLDSDDDKTDDEDELEDMDLEEEEEEGESDEELEGDAPEDLTTKSSSSATSTPTQHGHKDKHRDLSKLSHPALPLAGSLVGELMDKFGLSNIQQYNEAYKQALQESGGLKLKDDKPLHGNNNERIRDNNNISSSLMKKRHENGLDKAMQFHEDLRKGIIGQHHMDINPHLFGFDMPFDASKRLKLDLENHPLRNDRDIYAGLSWLPTMAPTPRDLFGVDHPGFDMLTGRKTHDKSSRDPKPGSSAMSAAVAAGMNMGMGPGVGSAVGRKESRRNDTCEYCGKIFKNCSNLTVHRRSHTGEKPYKCELCSYACAQSSKLTRHMKTHGRLGKDVYRCRFCEMPFSVPSTLEKHMRKCVVNQNNKAAAAANAGNMLGSSMISGGDDTGDSSASASKDAT